MKANHYNYLVIGAGVIGLSVALELKRRHPKSKIAVLDKEARVAYHSSGRNSGVLHAGFYYTADSLKALFTKKGNLYWKEYCRRKGLHLNECGKLVVTKTESELSSLDELFVRAKKNEIDFQDISESEAKKIEPRVKTVRRAGWSPTTATIDPLEVMESLRSGAVQNGIDLQFDTRYVNSEGTSVFTTRGTFEADFVINAAGLYADQIANDYGMSQDYRILPFKGLYVYSSEPKGAFKTHVYPVPNLKNPFLGVHHTLTVDGKSKIGPTAVPAFWREQYSGFSRFRFNEAFQILKDETRLFFFSGFNFRGLAMEEIRKYRRKNLVNESSLMATDVDIKNYKTWGKPGIRAQLFNIKTRKLEMDFKVQGDERSFHVLNAVSPAFTCAQPFAEYICDRVGTKFV